MQVRMTLLRRLFSSSAAAAPRHFEILAKPAPGSPYHMAFPVHCIDAARAFYTDVIGCELGRSSAKWQDFALQVRSATVCDAIRVAPERVCTQHLTLNHCALQGHQIVAHEVKDYRCVDYYNPVDGDGVPV
jgi:extradiol dioxygenase family protein